MPKVFTILLIAFVLGICSTYSEEKYELNTIRCNSIELNKFIVDSTVNSHYYTWFQYHYSKTDYTIIRVEMPKSIASRGVSIVLSEKMLPRVKGYIDKNISWCKLWSKHHMVMFANSYIFYNDRLRLNNYCILK